MDLSLSEDERHLKDAARNFARKEIAPVADRMDREDYFPRDVFLRLGEQGFLGVTIPTKWGGLGLSYRAQAIILEEIARLSPALALTVGAHSNLFANNLALNGSDRQREEFLPAVVRGEQIGALALTEPNAGSDAVSIRTRAVRRGEEYVLDGAKQFITNGPVADVLLVYAKTDPDRGSHGISAFLVRRDSPGSPWRRAWIRWGCGVLRPENSGSRAFECPSLSVSARRTTGCAS